MTVYNKRFINFEDVLAISCECRHCGTILEIKLTDLKSGSLFECPNCRADWALLNSGTPVARNLEKTFLDFAEAALNVERVCKNAPVGFSLKFQIKNEPV